MEKYGADEMPSTRSKAGLTYCRNPWVSTTMMMSVALDTSALNRRSDWAREAAASSRPRVTRPSSAMVRTVPSRLRAARPCTSGWRMRVGQMPRTMASCPRPIQVTVPAIDTGVAREPKSWKAEPEPKMKPTDRIGPHPVA